MKLSATNLQVLLCSPKNKAERAGLEQFIELIPAKHATHVEVWHNWIRPWTFANFARFPPVGVE